MCLIITVGLHAFNFTVLRRHNPADGVHRIRSSYFNFSIRLIIYCRQHGTFNYTTCTVVCLNRFQKEILAHGDVMGYRMVPPADVFAEASVNKDNVCFCPSGTDCAPHGTFNVSACAFGKLILPVK